MKQFRDTNYYVTPTGDVYSNKSGELKKLKPGIRNNYYYVRIYNNTIKNSNLHRMVGECYIPNPNNYPHINHINGIKTDNRVENLEWVTPSMNNLHKTKVLNKGIGETNGFAKLTEEQVKYIRQNYIPKHKQFGQAALSRKFNVKELTIHRIIHNKTWR